MPAWTRDIRWWWWLGILWIVGAAVATNAAWRTPAIRRVLLADPPALLGALLPVLMGFAWLVVAAPILESGIPRFTERRTGRRRILLCRVFAWVPTVVFALLLVQVIIVYALGIEHFGWYGRGYGAWVAGAVAFSLFYGRMMSRQVERRVRAAARSAGVCVRCSYDISGSASVRCPECGEPR